MTKILISIVMSLIVVSSSCNFHFAKILEIAGLTEKFNIDENVTENVIENNEELQTEKAEEPVIQNTEIKKAEVKQPKQENNVTQSNIENKTKTESQPVTTKKHETKVENKTTNTTNKTTNTNTQNNQSNNNVQQNTQSANTQIQVPKQEQQVQQTPQVTEQPQVKQEEQESVQEVVQEPVIELKRNDEMIQKIKKYITEHETERMRKYGYSFKVDPSVVKITTPFTYSEYNMNTCLNLIGEYRIYAQDYYYNGQFVETQCFVY